MPRTGGIVGRRQNCLSLWITARGLMDYFLTPKTRVCAIVGNVGRWGRAGIVSRGDRIFWQSGISRSDGVLRWRTGIAREFCVHRRHDRLGSRWRTACKRISIGTIETVTWPHCGPIRTESRIAGRRRFVAIVFGGKTLTGLYARRSIIGRSNRRSTISGTRISGLGITSGKFGYWIPWVFWTNRAWSWRTRDGRVGDPARSRWLWIGVRGAGVSCTRVCGSATLFLRSTGDAVSVRRGRSRRNRC